MSASASLDVIPPRGRATDRRVPKVAPSSSSRPPSRPPSRTRTRETAGGASCQTPPSVPLSRGPGSLRHLDSSSFVSSSELAAPRRTDSRVAVEIPHLDTNVAAQQREEKRTRTRQGKHRSHHTTNTESKPSKKSHKKRTSNEGMESAVRAQPESASFTPVPPPLPPSPASSQPDYHSPHSAPPPPPPPPPARLVGVEPSQHKTVPAARTMVPRARADLLPPLMAPTRVNLILCLSLSEGSARAAYAEEEEADGPDEVHVPGVRVASTAMGDVLTRLDAYMGGFFSARAPEQLETFRTRATPGTAASPPLFFLFPDDNEAIAAWLRPTVKQSEFTALSATSVLADMLVEATTVRETPDHTGDDVEVVLWWFDDPSELLASQTPLLRDASSLPWTDHHSDHVDADALPVLLETASVRPAETRYRARSVLAPPADVLAAGVDESKSCTHPPARPDWLRGAVDAADSTWHDVDTASASWSEEEIEILIDSDDDEDGDDGLYRGHDDDNTPANSWQRFGGTARGASQYIDPMTPVQHCSALSGTRYH